MGGSSARGQQPDRHGVGVCTDDAVHDPCAVTVVLGVVGGVHDRVGYVGADDEVHVSLDAAGADPAFATGDRPSVPNRVGSASGANVDLSVDADDPHGDVGP